ncbi:cytochrome P450 [Streptomyces sp. RPT161]|uniref:cytochrome P450 n=1 Tax=Streptomyces sp. RPT161 TaxID=3015993 RepID=UPI0022B8EFB7|nr:cytochrome P450 [Streptomyces sp. RPT161]
MTDVSTSAPTRELPAFPMARGCPFDPPEQYSALRAERPIARVALPGDRTAWLVTRHDLLRQLLTDPRLSSDRTHPNLPTPVPSLQAQAQQDFAPIANALIGLDAPRHSTHRRMLITEFTVKRVQALRPRIQEIAEGCVADLLAGPRPADLVSALSLPVPSMVICELLGVPYADRDFFQSRTRTVVSFNASPEDRSAAIRALRGFLDELVTAKEREPSDDLLGRLILRNREAEVFTHELLVGLAALLLLAGHETTANMISLGTAGLLQNPQQLDQLRADPALVGQTVEELLRYFSIVDAIPRVALADIEIGGVTIHAGDGVALSVGGANRDGVAFGRADELDIQRGGRHHVAFGYGIHQCLGQNLARMELEIVFTTLFARVPGLRLAAPVAELPFKDDATIYGLYQLPVTW